jgi:hypothetical protein
MDVGNRTGSWIIGIGFEKAGTTALESILRGSPGFSAPRDLKETLFFSARHDAGEEWFLNLFGDQTPGTVRIEFTPSYIRDEVALHRIKAFFEEVKIIINMRNPVYRAFSHYWHNIYHNCCVFDKIGSEISVEESDEPYANSFF